MAESVRVSLRLSNRERRLLVDEILFGAHLGASERELLGRPGPATLTLTLDEWDDLAGHIAAAANHAPTRFLARQLDALYERVDELLQRDPRHVIESEGALILPMPAAPGRNGGARLVGLSPLTEEEMGEWLDRLMASNWRDPEGPVRFAGDLGYSDVADAAFLHNARELLGAVAERGPVRFTTAGNLPRRFVAEMLDRGRWRADAGEYRRGNKVINEQDVWDLHIARIVCEQAKLLRTRQGSFYVPKRVLGLLADERAGELYRELFIALFSEINLDYLSRGPEFPVLQDTIPYCLVALSACGNRWWPIEELVEQILAPGVYRMAVAISYSGDPTHLAMGRVLNPLRDFGLVERRELPGEPAWRTLYEYRKTRLFGKFISFYCPR